MPTDLLPQAATDTTDLADPQAVVEAFLAALAAEDADTARSLIDDEIHYVNMGLPAVHGRAEMERVFALLDRPDTGFEVYVHAIAADGDVVLTERTDVLIIGPLRIQIWVWGRFDVRDGRITLWRDSFDFFDSLKATVRAAVALKVPSLMPVAPSGPGAVPGR